MQHLPGRAAASLLTTRPGHKRVTKWMGPSSTAKSGCLTAPPLKRLKLETASFFELLLLCHLRLLFGGLGYLLTTNQQELQTSAQPLLFSPLKKAEKLQFF